VLDMCFNNLGMRVHPATKCCHKTDVVVIRNNQRNDVQMFNWWTDGYMVRGRLRMVFLLSTNVIITICCA